VSFRLQELHSVRGQAVGLVERQLRYPETAGSLDRQLTVSFAFGYCQLSVECAAFLPDRHQPQMYGAFTLTVDKIVNMRPVRNVSRLVQPVGTVSNSGLWDGSVRDLGSIPGRGKI
jgi:hypothetical protein